MAVQGSNGWSGSWKPVGAPTDPFHVAQQLPGTHWDTGQYARTPTGNTQLEQSGNRSASFTYYNQLAGIDPLSAKGQFIRAMFPQVSSGYEAYQAEQPNTTFQDYYRMILPQLQLAFQSAPPDQRGEQITRFVRPARTIARGS